MTYTTVFDVGTDGLRNLWMAAIGLPFLVIGGVSLNSARWRGFGWVLVMLGTLFSLMIGVAMISDALSAASALRNGDYQLVEGQVEHLHTTERLESFDLDGIHFSYSDAVVTAAFNHSALYGGPMRECLQVRIAYRSGRILRLEVADRPLPPIRRRPAPHPPAPSQNHPQTAPSCGPASQSFHLSRN